MGYILSCHSLYNEGTTKFLKKVEILATLASGDDSMVLKLVRNVPDDIVYKCKCQWIDDMMGELAVRAWIKGWVPRREMNRREDDMDCRSVCSEVSTRILQ
jgi:hypothetical protein